MKQLQVYFRKFPEDLFANAVDDEGSNGVLAAAEDAGLDTVKWLEQNGVSSCWLHRVLLHAIWGTRDICIS